MIKNWKKGFTLIELIVVIAIIAILSMILIPGIVNYIDEANVAADKANLRVLNLATSIYKSTTSHSGDIFVGISTDLSRQNKLIEQKYAQEVILPSKSGSSFYWDKEKQVWEYSESVLAVKTTTTIAFKEKNLNDYRKTGSWTKTADGFVSSNGTLFIPTSGDEYTVSSTAKLPPGNSGGYGLLIESTLTEKNKDTGYSVQLDRGQGGIVIRTRTDAKSSNAIIASAKNSNNEIIPISKTDSWWTKEHTLKVDVKNSPNPEKKIITVYINDVAVITDIEINANPNPDSNYTGLRSWNGKVTYKELETTK